MVEITINKDDAVLTFPKEFLTDDYVQEFVERLRLEAIVEKSKLTEEQAFELSEIIKQDWWKKNRDSFLKKIDN